MYIESMSWDRASRRCSDTREFFSLACTPHEETCTQAGDDVDDMRKECEALINQLIRVHGTPPEDAEFFIIRNFHETGTYLEAGIWYKPEADQYHAWDEGEGDVPESPSMNYALKCESGIPEKWDEPAIAELREAGHSRYQPAKVIPIKKTA